MVNGKHIAKTGAKQGQWVACTAKECRNGGVHVTDAELSFARAYFTDKKKTKVSKAKVPLTEVINYTLLTSEEKDIFIQKYVDKLYEDKTVIGGSEYSKYYKKYKKITSDTQTDEENLNEVEKLALDARIRRFEHGFKSIDANNYKGLNLLTEEESLAESRSDLASCSKKEKEAIAYYSTENFEWINTALYEEQNLVSIKGSKAFFGTGKIFEEITSVNSGESWSNPYVTPESEQTQEALKETVETIDKALAKTPRRSNRIVYRGLRGDINGIAANQWVEQNARLGKEITFKGYQSATASFDIANETYAYESDSVIFEISTPKGLNISSISSYSEEQEVLLPRNTKYIVVGNHKVKRANGKTATTVQLVAVADEELTSHVRNSKIATPLKRSMRTWLTSFIGQ